MHLDEMTDEEKSVLLARAMKESMFPGKYLSVMSPEFKPINLYDPANMALAWRVLNWAFESLPVQGEFFYAVSTWVQQPPAIAQRQWLDKILTLAIKAGIVKVS